MRSPTPSPPTTASFDTGSTAPGAEGEFTAPAEPGTYAFHCAIHASMTGTLTVAA